VRFLDPLVGVAHDHHRCGSVPARQLRDEHTRLHGRIEHDELLRFLDRGDVEDIEAAIRPVVRIERARDRELSLAGEPPDVREVAGKDGLALVSLDLRVPGPVLRMQRTYIFIPRSSAPSFFASSGS
jgi:hypothetical protein